MAIHNLVQRIVLSANSNNVKTILDVGSCDAKESIELSEYFPNAKIYAFEANPKSYLKCLENVKNHPNITIINKAVNDFDGVCKFYPINTEKTITIHKDGNPGASSLFKSNGAYNHIETYVQDEIEVECTRLDTWAKENNITETPMIWMDLQGAELQALQGLGDLIKTTKIIHTELYSTAVYTGQCLLPEVQDFLKKKDLKKRGEIVITISLQI